MNLQVSMQKEVSVDETDFHKSLQELRDFSAQLYHTAEYCEASFLAAEDKRIIMENTKQYISRSVVTAVEHIGSISATLESCLSKTSSINPETNRKIDSLKMRMVACQQRSHKLALDGFYLTSADFSRHHCRYILPNQLSSEDEYEEEEEFKTEEPLFLHTHHCNSSREMEINLYSVLPVRGDGLSILPKSDESVFQFKESLKLKRSAIHWKALHSRDMASFFTRAKRILNGGGKELQQRTICRRSQLYVTTQE